MGREWIYNGRQFDFGPRDKIGAVMIEVYDGCIKLGVLSVNRVRRYSCSGINWGSDTGGSKDLSIMILKSHFELSGMEQRAVALADAHYEDFCKEIVSKLPDVFVLPGCLIEDWYRSRVEKAV